MRLFGWEFLRVEPVEPRPSFAPRESDDGAVIVAAGGAFGTYVDLDGTVRTEAELVTKYREMALQPEIMTAVDEIINESMSLDEKDIVEINLDNLENMSDSLKEKIRAEFDNCLNILNFRKQAYEIYRRWYIDGRLYYHVIIDEDNPKAGIQEIRYVDPRKIRKIREISKRTVPGGTDFGQTNIPKTQNEYYIFNDRGFNYGNKVVGPSTAGLKIAKDSILHVTSGLTDNQGTMVLGYLHLAIKAINQLRTLEDALVIYRLSRAPERRIWYIDVGNLPKMKAEQYVREIMVKHKNRLIYDSESGQIRDDRKFMTMLEDYWLPRREGGRGTEVTTLPGGQNLGQMEDVLYFQKKLYQTLFVPVNRLNSDALFSIGRATEVTRDEIKFSRFVSRLRSRFSQLFTKMLEKQLALKQVMTLEEFAIVGPELVYDFARDNYFTELKDNEILSARTEVARSMQDMVGKYYSQSWLRKNVLQQSDDDIEQMDREIEGEYESGDIRWQNPLSLQQTMVQPQETDMPEPGSDQFQQALDDHEKNKSLQQAKAEYDLLKKKPNRSLADQAKFHSVAQVVAKNGLKTDSSK
jgi:capsid assembly protein Gp20